MVGSNNPRKNFNFIGASFATQYKDQVLVIAGGSHANFSANEMLQAPNIIHLDYITDNVLKWLYTNCIAMINPSLYEGFGIPNLEAMALKSTLLCSDIPVFREVCKNAAYYFDPTSKDSFHERMKEMLENENGRRDKKDEGMTIARSYQSCDRVTELLRLLGRQTAVK